MIVGIGVDICRIERLARLRERHGARFLDRVFTPGEQAYCGLGPNCDQRYAARFAAKEACLKALGTGFSAGTTLKDVAVVSTPSGRPELVITGQAEHVLRQLGVVTVHVSLSHEREHAIAFVVLER
jgi:holo-[acyl-carrier protein] synthase